MKGVFTALVLLAGATAMLLGMPGCGPLVKVRATVRADARTRLEREVLGERARSAPYMVLLPLRPPRGAGLAPAERARLYQQYVELSRKLAESTPKTAALRAWEVVSLHNRAVLRARDGETEEATRLLEQAASRADAWWLQTLAWQIELTRAELAERGGAKHLTAARAALLDSIPLTELDYALEHPDRIDRLYALLIAGKLDGESEQAFRYALEREAVRLARATPPGELVFPAGPLGRSAEQLAAAREAAVRARRQRCRLGAPELADSIPFKEAEVGKQLTDAAAAVRDASPAGALLVPDPADPVLLREALPADAALLLYAPLDEVSCAAFMLWEGPLQGEKVQYAPRAKDARNLLGVLEGEPAEQLNRLYICFPASLSGLSWQNLPFGEGTVLDRFEVAFLGGAADLPAAAENKHYGRESVLLCCAGEGGGPAQRLRERENVTVLGPGETSKAELRRAMALPDVLWLGPPIKMAPGLPGATYLTLPGGLGRLGGVTVEELAAFSSRPAAAGLAGFPDGAFGADHFLALRVLSRALIAAGMPSVTFGIESADDADFWEAFLVESRAAPPSEAFRRAALDLEPAARPNYRLYGFLGMKPAEYAEYSRLEFNDTFRAARTHLENERFGQAASRLLDLRRMAEVVPFPSESRRSLVLANVESYLVRCYRGMGQPGLAAGRQRARLKFLQQVENVAAEATASEYQSLGALLTRARRFEEAASAYRKSVELLQETDDPAEVAHVLGELGKSLDRAGRYGDALETFEGALEAYQRLESPAAIALQHQRMGAIQLRRLGDAPRAEEHFREAARLYGEAGKTAEAAGVRVDIGLCRRRMGNFAAARRHFSEAAATAEEQGFPDVHARAMTETANTRWLEGRYQSALELIARSNRIAEEREDAYRLNVNHQLEALIYWELNRYGAAHQALDRAVEAARRTDRPLELASAHNNRGIIYRRQEKYGKALEALRRALELDERLRSTWGQGYDHRNIGITLHRMGRLEEAREHLLRAVELSRSIGDAVNVTRSLLALGDIALEMEKLQEAERLLNDAREEAARLYLPEVQWRALRGLGRLRLARGRQAEAWEAFKSAIEVVEEIRAGIKVEELRSGFMVNKMDLYEQAVKLLLEMGRPAEAFHYAERSRSRKFLDVLAGREVQLKNAEERELYRRQRELARQLRGLRQALGREQDPRRRDELSRQLDENKQRYADLMTELRAASPGLAGFVSVEAVRSEELTDAVPEGTALLVYYLLEDEVVLWVWRRGELSTIRVPADRDELSEAVREYRVQVQNRALLEEVRRASQELYAVLLQPAEELLEGARVVGVVPHRALHYLSFACLHDGEGFLVERVPLFYSPSASVLRRTLAEEKPTGGRQLRVLALGNPDVGQRAYELPFTEQEVVSIGRDFDRVTPLLGPEASEDRLREEIGRYDIVHIGAHGRLDAASPLFSSLVLAPQKQDGLLHLHEVTGLEIGAQLVTLSACQSGVGQLQAADELVSLSRAFGYAGAHAILSTLWRVDDVSTALVSKHFYRHYAQHGAAQSLRHAQLQVMNDGRHYHPSYWAGVTLTGDYR